MCIKGLSRRTIARTGFSSNATFQKMHKQEVRALGGYFLFVTPDLSCYNLICSLSQQKKVRMALHQNPSNQIRIYTHPTSYPHCNIDCIRQAYVQVYILISLIFHQSNMFRTILSFYISYYTLFPYCFIVHNIYYM